MSYFTKEIIAQAQDVIAAARKKKIRLATAESCTGGLISACLTEVSGASEVFDEGFITYSYEAKVSQLHIAPRTLADHGAVSPQVALDMAEGALRSSSANIVVSATGIAGPGGGTPDKPVGLVYVAVAVQNQSHVKKNLFKGDRAEVRSQTVSTALQMLKTEIEKYGENA